MSQARRNQRPSIPRGLGVNLWHDSIMWSDEDDAALRTAAMEWLAFRTHDGLDPISYEDLGDFTFRGERRPLKDRQLGIYKPRVLSAALSITTTYRAPGQSRPYEDSPGWTDCCAISGRATIPRGLPIVAFERHRTEAFRLFGSGA